MSDDISKMALYQAKYRNPGISAILNLILPGAGYMYCGKIILGLCVFVFAIIVLLATVFFGAIILYPILVIDGVLCANRVNKKLAKELQMNQENKIKCPFCAELIQKEAKICKHCNKSISD